jgi:hypothetical protein
MTKKRFLILMCTIWIVSFVLIVSCLPQKKPSTESEIVKIEGKEVKIIDIDGYTYYYVPSYTALAPTPETLRRCALNEDSSESP